MSNAALLGWTVVALLGVMTPGIDTLLVLRHTMIGGRRAGLMTVIGICAGCLVWATASLIGLTALLTASQLAYDIVRIAGAVYLVWLGATAIWKTLPRNQRPEPTTPDTPRVVGTWSALRTGMLTNLLNPKVGVFYISLLLRERVRRWLDRVIATVLIGLGVKLAAEAR